MNHKLTKVFLTAVICLLCTSVQAQIQTTINGLNYVLSDHKAALISQDTATVRGAVVIPSNVTYEGNDYTVILLGYRCFNNCRHVTSVDVPNSVTGLGDGCFNGCSSMTAVSLPNSITEMGNACFANCSSLTSVDIPDSVTSISKWCFNGCSALTSVSIPHSVTLLSDLCFYCCTSLESIDLPNSIVAIEGDCFNGCTALKSIVIPNSVTSMDYCCFWGCTSLTTVVLPSSLSYLSDDCFIYCSALTSVYIPNSITSLGIYCFCGCSSLTSIDIPASVCSIGKNCFQSCSSLTDVTVHWSSSLPLAPDNVFSGCPVTNLTVPTGARTLYEAQSPWNVFTTITEKDVATDTTAVTLCAAPSITYADGKLKFESTTTGAVCHYTITMPDAAEDVTATSGEATLEASYHVFAYATAAGYRKSETTTATLYWLTANLDDKTAINAQSAKLRGVLASGSNGTVSVSGLDEGETVAVYSLSGTLLGNATATTDSTASLSIGTQDKMVLARIGSETIKVVMK